MAYYLGFDFGSVFNKAVLLDEGGGILHSSYERSSEDTVKFINDFLSKAVSKSCSDSFIFSFTGLKPDSASKLNNNYCSEIVAVATGINHLSLGASGIIEIGGHSSRYIVLGDGGRQILSFSTNEACAAGTGSFLEQQSKRLQLSIEELSKISSEARRYARIAGRCSVFAKSDMIHLQQKGTPLAEIAYGLCIAIVRNAIATLLKSGKVVNPSVIAGGCALNEGILRAFNELVFSPSGVKMLRSPMPGLESAIGAAINIKRSGSKPVEASEIIRYLTLDLFKEKGRVKKSNPPLIAREISREEQAEEPSDIYTKPVEGYLGVDVGSVSVDLVVLDKCLKVISSVYLPTCSRPAEVIYKGLNILKERFRGGLRVLGCGTTGSGRYLAARLLNADVVKNEITCQTLSALLVSPDVDTIFEIGGQDSKYISVNNGSIADFQMNKICAAGTGSFLEEQASDLGIGIKEEFSDLAFVSQSPLDLSSRCTVFMETEVVNAVKSNQPVSEITAGLAYSIVRNYLDRVVGHRKIGNKILFQGGVASNRAVVAAFESILKKRVSVNPYNRISGAIGAAYATSLEPRKSSSFIWPDTSELPRLRSFECRQCANNCEVNIVETKGVRAYFGDTCEKYTSGDVTNRTEPQIPNLATEFLEMAKDYLREYEKRERSIGIPRASVMFAYLPFFATFFGSLGFRPLLSEATGEKTLIDGLKRLPVGACLPIKLAAGHISGLIESKADLIFVPAMFILVGEENQNLYACPYTQAVPFMIHTEDMSQKVLSPVIILSDRKKFVSEFNKYKKILNATENSIQEAFDRAVESQMEFESRVRQVVQNAISAKNYRYLFAVVGKPYNTLDPYINLNLFERLRRMGILGVPAAYLTLPTEDIMTNLPWKFSADMYRQIVAIGSSRKDIYPVIVSNFGCGPDAFTFKRMENYLKNITHLILEFDEHRGDAGLVTRLEAFCDQIEYSRREKRAYNNPKVTDRKIIEEFPEPEKTEIVIPYFADQVFAFSGLFKFKGYRVKVLDLPNEQIQNLGEKYSIGKECHAYSVLLGDLINVALKNKDSNTRTTFYLPGTQIPCLMHQYGEGMRVLLSNLGVENIVVLSPNGDQLINQMGLEAMERYYKGLWAIELLEKAVCEIRPYELDKGLTDMVHRTNLLLIEQAIAYGDIYDAFDVALKNLSQIKIRREERRPLIGIAGDVYTRVNPAANFELYKRIEEVGCEVWPSPFQIDLIDFGIYRRFYNSFSEFNLQDMLKNGALVAKKAIEEFRIARIVDGRIKKAQEPTYNEVVRLASRYIWNESSELLFLNIAKIVDFAQRGADGVINATCFNCMIGNASDAIIQKIRRDYREIPIITTVYSNTDDPSRDMILDTFLYQVKMRFKAKNQKV